mgnify:FL=1
MPAPAAPKGMRDIIGDAFYKYQGFFEKAAEIASYYGFTPIETPILERKEIFEKTIGGGTDIVEKEMYTLRTKGGDILALRPEGTAAIMRAYVEHGMNALPQPVMLYYYGPFFRHERPQRGRFREFFQFGIESLGTKQSIADALTIRVSQIILEECGIKNLCVLINSIGEKDSRAGYVKDLTAYYRKRIDDLGPEDRERLKTNPLRILDSKDPKTKEVNKGAPESIQYLNESCKEHFREVLEYLEEMGVPYRIENSLVRGLDYYTRTVFEIISDTPSSSSPRDASISPEKKEGDAPDAAPAEQANAQADPGAEPLALAGGGRYDNLAKIIGSRRDIPAVGASLGVDRIVSLPEYSAPPPRMLKSPKVYFIQIGTGAKLKSLNVIETLRKARIPVLQALNKNKLSAQLGIAEKLNIPYVLIFGQKEAIEGTVIVRDMSNHSQDTMPLTKLAEYLKGRK